MKLKAVAILLLFAGIGAVHADAPADTPLCMAPSRANLLYQSDYADFRQRVETYKRCIDAFIEQQQQAARDHMDAAEKAEAEWKRFVETELN